MIWDATDKKWSSDQELEETTVHRSKALKRESEREHNSFKSQTVDL